MKVKALHKTRFIPADAGNSHYRRYQFGRQTVHPRGRGEQATRLGGAVSITGSSPRTRGTVTPAIKAEIDQRFIPADAGNRALGMSNAGASSVHPRGRGEQLPRPKKMGRLLGSSPRTRGTDRFSHDPGPPDRFIPADAGNSRVDVGATLDHAVHPRGRGEQFVRVWGGAPVDGSSPRTRGTGRCQGQEPRQSRFIPADAGTRKLPQQYRGPATVHPRGRGEQAAVVWLRLACTGSSPRTRGTG